jgi:hypothetical protein
VKPEVVAYVALTFGQLGLYVLISAAFWLGHRLRAERWAAIENEEAGALRPGRRILHGRVDGSGTAVSVEITESLSCEVRPGRDRHFHEWNELMRRVEARPFEIMTRDGRVRVEADERTLLVSSLSAPDEAADPHRTMRRLRRARLCGGEMVHVIGEVATTTPALPSYREPCPPSSMVIRAPRFGHLVLADQSLAADDLASARWHKLAVMWLLGTLAFMELLQLTRWNYSYSINGCIGIGFLVMWLRALRARRPWYRAKLRYEDD